MVLSMWLAAMAPLLQFCRTVVLPFETEVKVALPAWPGLWWERPFRGKAFRIILNLT
jgi:hypothetical protein